MKDKKAVIIKKNWTGLQTTYIKVLEAEHQELADKVDYYRIKLTENNF